MLLAQDNGLASDECEEAVRSVELNGANQWHPDAPAGPLKDRSSWLKREILPHERQLRQWLLRKVRCPIALDDIMQDVFLRLSQAASVEHIEAPKHYLWSTATSVVRDHARRARATPVSPADLSEIDEFACESPSPLRQLCAREELERVAESMKQLSARTRDVLLLRRLERLSLEQTASRLGISVSAVEKHQRRAHRFLRKQMAPV